jgi:hypothetical protein
MAIPDICRGHAQKVVDIANQKIRALRTKHKENMMDAERHIGLLHNSMERVVNAKSPQHSARALNAMKDMFTSTVRGRSSKTGRRVSPSEEAGKIYGAQKSTNMRILGNRVRDIIGKRLKKKR